MSLTQLTDIELLENIRLGDSSAFRQLFEQYWELLHRLAAQKTGDDGDAEDMVQELFIELWRKKAPIVLTSSLKTYLVSCMYLKIFQHFRKKGFREKHYEAFAHFLEQASTAPDPIEFETEYGKLQEIVEQVVSRMPVQMQTVFSLKHYHGESVAGIAEQLDISTETVKSHLKTAMSRLRKAGEHYPSGVLLLPAFLTMMESSY
ncbi:sigma-70 family RNA polymerase sigma factor [Chitinophaga sp. SYP-B3965]|uniref:RNA polymerase sigma factor n=1 Tax=Chitinophaga sp. SYP-B3965 TaxID=2663120 RepID=UPI001299F675|nr:sigma-70 family RNA polymerase sigma factor [Chitinophaga sp. SYP-B3965]MRG45078.1 sigma-70 family RNA polymerase sigma factor [Chitinophaga sp. SYP-B3965]